MNDVMIEARGWEINDAHGSWSYLDSCDSERRNQVRELLKELSSSKSAPEITAEYFEKARQQNNVVTALAMDRSGPSPRIVGMAMLFIHWKFSKGGGYVEDVVVNPGYRGQKLGKRLMEKLIEIAEYYKLPKIELTSNPNNEARAAAIEMYLKLGFKLIAKSVDEKGTNLYRLVLS